MRDLTNTLKPEALEEAIRHAEHHRLASITSLVEGLSHSRNAREGLAKADLGRGPTRKAFEQRSRRFLRNHDLPRPTSFNAPMELNGKPIEVDALWRSERLIVELDGRAAHATADAFQVD